jgi:hypothetical protein
MPVTNTYGTPRTIPDSASAQPPLVRMIMELESENHRQKDTIRNLLHELQKYKDLSDIQGKEVITNRVFLSKADVLSISDIKDKVNALNQEIFQASAVLSQDSLIHHKYDLAKEELEAAFADVCRTVSEPLARVLVRERQKPRFVLDPEPMLVQVVLGMYLVHFCSSRMFSWLPETQETSFRVSALYTSDIRRSGQSRYQLSQISF